MATANQHVQPDRFKLPHGMEIGDGAIGAMPMPAGWRTEPPAFVLTTEVGRLCRAAGGLSGECWEAAEAGLADLEYATGRSFGGTEAPLLVSVRPGGRRILPVSDAIPNVGINDDIEASIAAESGDPAFARNAHLLFIAAFARSILQVTTEYRPDTTPAALRAAAESIAGAAVPHDPEAQLRAAICTAFCHASPRAEAQWRAAGGLGEYGGIPVTVQAMVPAVHEHMSRAEMDDELETPGEAGQGQVYNLADAGRRSRVGR
jgi:pyruvate,orthophosphate dikinase